MITVVFITQRAHRRKLLTLALGLGVDVIGMSPIPASTCPPLTTRHGDIGAPTDLGTPMDLPLSATLVLTQCARGFITHLASTSWTVAQSLAVVGVLARTTTQPRLFASVLSFAPLRYFGRSSYDFYL